ncbi:MAG: FAD-binding and (Fe-S)-binding domain-containing protein [Candidatus Brocadiia bacterium]
MSALTRNRKVLEEKYGNRITFDRIERKLHGHDIAAMPGLFKPLIGNTTPEAVVQPVSEAEVVELMKWAISKGIAVTPRGKASSGYGGVLPIKKGLVIDSYRLRNLKSVDKQAMTATVEAGATWEKLDAQLAKHDLTLRLYPTSYPSSTVGGWLAQGGAGIGSYESGWFRENVVSARVVLPSGEVRTFQGPDLEVISDAEGITGFITEVTIKVMKKADFDVISLGCPNPYDLQKLIEAMIAQDLPIWSLMFINPRMAELKNRSPLMEHLGHPIEHRVLLPASYIVTLAFRREDFAAAKAKLTNMIRPCEAEILSDEIAQHEWASRFKLMVVKRLGPSLVPAEVIVPLASLGSMMDEVEKKIDQPLVKEGVVILKGADGKPEVVILGFIPSDQRKLAYNFVFGLTLTLMKIAQRKGGRPYSTGLYFSSKVKEVLGAQRAAKMKVFKKQVDPRGKMNPGKVLGGNGLLGIAIGLASTFEPIVRSLGNHFISKVGENPTKPVRGIPADVAWYAYSCSQCGYCIEECDQFYGRGWESQSPRGKWYWLREFMEGREKWNQFMVDTFLVCTTCELCNRRCSAALPIEPSWMKLRGKMIHEDKRMTFPPFEMMAAASAAEGDIWAGYRKDRAAWFPKDLLEKHGPKHRAKMVYFAGCTASYVEHDIGIATVRLLDRAGVDFTYLAEAENCCSTPMLVAGKWELFSETMQKNIRAVKASGADTVVCSCPACDMMWRNIYPIWAKKLGIEYGIKAKHYSEIVSEKIKSGEFSFPDTGKPQETVTWHDSCHIGRVSGVYEPPRDLIRAMPNTKFVEMEHHHECAHCCGSVLTLIKDPPVAHDIGKMRLDEAVDAGASKVLALCPCCEFQLRVSAEKRDVNVEVVDLARFCAESLGYTLPDPNPEVRAQWAVFEGMIALMTPKGFAELMGTMWPEIIDAMPYKMGPMMRVMGHIPGALTLMKPMFPILFPRMLPGMMPRLMPTMLERVKARVPMPSYMAEQMPILIPQVMDNLMPHMIGDVVPLVTAPMIDYLHGKKKTV